MYKSCSFFFIVCCMLNWSCSPVLQRVWVDPAGIELSEKDSLSSVTRATGLYKSCLDWENYVPDTLRINHLPVRTILVNIHFMNSRDSAYNFKPKDGVRVAEEMIYHVNHLMAENKKMHLPLGNDTPVLPTRIKYELSPHPDIEGDKGVYFHFDDDLYYIVTKGKDRNLTDKRAIDKYKVRDSVLNLFILPHHPDSVASATYGHYGSGIALGTAVKLCGLFENNLDAWHLRGTTAHEFAHVLGLAHSWSGYDSCDDTPKHANCYNYTDTPPCDKEVSNNMMDYNLWQEALTPCQIAKMHINISRFDTNLRKIVKPDWCTYDSSATIVIRDSVVWGGSKDLAGDIVIENGGKLTIRCRVSMAKGASILVRQGAELILDNAYLHNSCGASWDGIQMETIGKMVPKIRQEGVVRIENVMYPLNQGS